MPQSTLHAAPGFDSPLAGRGHTAWILSDGKIGDLVQCRGLANCLGVAAEERLVRPGAPFTWFMPRGPIDPREAPGRSGSPLTPPFPDIAIASGRRTIAYLRRLKRDSAGAVFTVFLKDPRIGAGAADFIWVPEHDRLRASNVFATTTSPHGLRQGALDALRKAPPLAIASLPSPRLTVLLGGPNATSDWDGPSIVEFAEKLERAAGQAGSVLVTPSRRTPPALLDATARAVSGRPSIVWRGEGDNPYTAFLALADAIVVTGDSVNMVGEALAAGRRVHVYRPPGPAGRIDVFLRSLAAAGHVTEFDGRLETGIREPIDSTPTIAAEVGRRYREWYEARGAQGRAYEPHA